MKYRYAAILFMIAFFLQTTLLNVISIFGATPNLLLCLVIMFSFLFDEGYYGMVFGVIFGLCYDICFAEYVGVSAVAFFLVSLSIMLINVVMNKEIVVSAVLITACETVLFCLIVWGLSTMMGGNYGIMNVLVRLPLCILYNSIISVLLYFALIKKVIKHHRDRYYK